MSTKTLSIEVEKYLFSHYFLSYANGQEVTLIFRSEQEPKSVLHPFFGVTKMWWLIETAWMHF